MQQTVFLIGFMGTGKTYWGARLTEKTGIPCYDLDALIEARESKTIAGIFTQFGEKGFRVMERETLQQCSLLGPAIVATGGGTPCFFDNMEWMNANGFTVYLKTSTTVLADRLKHERQFRPLLANVEEHDLETHLAKLLEHREPFYLQADVTLEYQGDDDAFFRQLLAAIGPMML